jgi:hypothetical protein
MTMVRKKMKKGTLVVKSMKNMGKRLAGRRVPWVQKPTPPDRWKGGMDNRTPDISAEYDDF